MQHQKLSGFESPEGIAEDRPDQRTPVNSPQAAVNRHQIISLIAGMGIGVSFLNLTPVLPMLQQVYGVSNAKMGFLITALVLSHSLVQVPAGVVVDKMGLNRSLALALIIGALGNGLCAINNSYGFVLIMRVMAGLGTGLVFVSGIKLATVQAHPSKHLMIQSIFGSLINMGSVIPFFVSPLLAEFGWRPIFLFTAMFFLLPLLLMALRSRQHFTIPSSPASESSQVVHRIKAVWYLGMSHAVFFGGMMTIGTWISSYLLSTYTNELWVHTTGMIGALVIGVSAFSRLLGGLVTRYVQPRKLIWYALLFLVPAYFLLGIFQVLALAVVLLSVVAVMNSVTFSSIFSLAFQSTSPRSAGTAIGLVNFIASLGALLIPVAFGYLIDKTASFKYPFLFLSMLALLTWAPAYGLRRASGK